MARAGTIRFARRLSLGWLFSFGVLPACGGASAENAPPAAAETSANTVEAAADAPAEPKPAEERAEAGAEPGEEGETAASEAPPEKDPNAPRDVKFVMTQDGLKVELEGTRFLVNAEAKKIAAGWGVRVKVTAQALDEQPHTLANPKNGPLAFSALVLRKGQSEPEQEGDKREGDGELTLKEGKKTEFSRDWPGKGGKILGAGDAIELQIGLWGIGESKESRRPLKNFARVKMKVDKGQPRAKIEPPPTQ